MSVPEQTPNQPCQLAEDYSPRGKQKSRAVAVIPGAAFFLGIGGYMSTLENISGFAELERNMMQFTARVEKNIVNGMVRAGAVVIQKEARQIVVKSGMAHYLGKGSKRVLIQPGNLKKNIKVRKAPYKNGVSWVYVSGKAWYWKFVEFGTSKMSPRPFMRPAFEVKKLEAIDRMKEYALTRIEKEASK